MKILRQFRSKKGFLSNKAGNEISQIGKYVYYMPELWNVFYENPRECTEWNLVCRGPGKYLR